MGSFNEAMTSIKSYHTINRLDSIVKLIPRELVPREFAKYQSKNRSRFLLLYQCTDVNFK